MPTRHRVARKSLRSYEHTCASGATNDTSDVRDKHALRRRKRQHRAGSRRRAPYEEAMIGAQHGFVQNEGWLTKWLRAFYAARGFETDAHGYLRTQSPVILRLGAEGKGPRRSR